MRLVSEIFELPGSASLKANLFLRSIFRELAFGYTKRFNHSNQYWKNVYKWGGNSGRASRGDVAAAKADFVNAVCSKYGIDTVVEYGCGDGVTASLITAKRYIGFDISPHAIAYAQDRCRDSASHMFLNYDGLSKDEVFEIVNRNKASENILSISMDVIFHLIEDETFFRYMDYLCTSPSKLVAVFCSDEDSAPRQPPTHYRDRAYSKLMIEKYGFELLDSKNLEVDEHGNRRDFKLFGKTPAQR